ncbi:MAG: extracellular solute-binding protein [Candidatus Firestonebacteria bacterium]|nr:extracellular solute-binding protein [Candidatus Firestonebacteria bacterium]
MKESAGITLPNLDSSDSVTLALAGGTAPDVLYCNLRKSTTFISQGIFRPLDEYFTDEDLKDVHPLIMPVIRQKGPKDTTEHTYLIPIGAPEIMALQYRKDLFIKAGLDPRKGPRDWEEFLEYCKKICNPEKNIYGWSAGLGAAAAWYFTNFVYQAGGEIINKNEKGEWQAVYNSKETLMALKFYKRLFHEKFIKNGKEYSGVVFRGGPAESARAMAEGRIAMSFQYVTEQNLLPINANPDVFEIAPLPLGPTGKGGGEFNASMLGINAQVKDKRVIEAAVKYLKFARSEMPKKIRTSLFVEEGFGRFLNPRYLKMFGFDNLLEDVNPEWVKVNEEAFKYAHPEPYGKNCDMIYFEMAGLLDKIQTDPNLDIEAELASSEKKTNEQLLGKLTPEEKKKRTNYVMIFIVLAGAISIFFFIRAIKIFKEMVKPTTINYQKTTLRNHLFAWLFMGVAVITVLMWSYFPVSRGLVMAFQDYKVTGTSEWAGLGNFVMVLWSPIFWQAVLNSFVYVGLTLLIGFFAPIFLALILNEIPFGSLFFRMVFYLPTVTSGIVVLLLWKQFYEPSDSGLFNQLLSYFNVSRQSWLFDPKLAMICIIVPAVWSHVGSGSIFYLAALKNVPEELYEAAAIDGAGIFSKLRHITFPTMSMLIIINFVGAFIGAFNATSIILVMTGDATAIAWILGSMLIGFTVLQLRILREVRFTSVNKL